MVETGLSLVIPAYNEGFRLEEGLERLLATVPADDTEIILVDDGSTDDTAEVARRMLAPWARASVVSLPRNCGKGAAVKAGVVRARGETIAYMDADMATDPKDMKALVHALGDAHVAVGSRSHDDSIVDRRGIHRTVMNRTFGMAVASMTQLPYTDTQCGFKAFRGPIAKLLFHASRVERFAFDVEVLELAARLRLRIEPVPVHWTDVAGSHVRPVHDGLQMLGDVARIRVARRAMAPIQGIWFRDLPLEEAGPVVLPKVRAVDLVVRWEGGTAVLFPCVPPTMARRATARLLAEFDELGPQMLSVSFCELVSPVLAQDVSAQEIMV